MSKRGSSKAEIILSGAREQVNHAKERVRSAQENLAMLIAGLTAHEEAYVALEKQLAPTPRKASGPKSTAPAAGKRSARSQEKAVSIETGKGDAGSVALCAIPSCGLLESAPVHDHDALHLDDDYHVFQAEIKKKSSKGNVVLPDDPDGFLEVCAEPVCGLPADAPVHYVNPVDYHPFQAEGKTKKAVTGA